MAYVDVLALQESYRVFNEDFEAIRAGDDARLLEGYWDPECEIYPLEHWPFADVYRGHEGYRQWFQDTFTPFERVHVAPAEYIEVEPGKVVVLGSISGHEIETGTLLEMNLCWIYELENGLIRVQRIFADVKKGREAAGLTV